MSVLFLAASLFVAIGTVLGLLTITGRGVTGFAVICPVKGCCGALFWLTAEPSIAVCNGVLGLLPIVGVVTVGVMFSTWGAGALDCNVAFDVVKESALCSGSASCGAPCSYQIKTDSAVTANAASPVKNHAR